MKWRKAEQYEIDHYQGVYPLCAYVSGVPATLNGVKTTYTVPIERCAQMSREDPKYEAIMPEGMHMADDPLHTLLGHDQKDLLGRLSAGMIPCGKNCEAEEKPEYCCPECASESGRVWPDDYKPE